MLPNSSQVVSFVDKLILAAGTIATMFGLSDAATIGPIETDLTTGIGGIAVLYSLIRAFTKHTHAAQVVTGAASAAAIGPVATQAALDAAAKT